MEKTRFAAGHVSRMVLISMDREPQVIRKYFLARHSPSQPLTADEANAWLATSRRYYRTLKHDAGVQVPQTKFLVAPYESGVALVSESEFLGYQNCGEQLLTSGTLDGTFALIDEMCRMLSRIDRLHASGLGADELVIGIGPTAYNFVFHDGQAFYVDFYPPRLRTGSGGRRLENDEVIIDGFRPYDDIRRRHVLRYFYTRSGIWMHWLAHSMMLAEDNPELRKQSEDIGALIAQRVLSLLSVLGLPQRAYWLSTQLRSQEFTALRRTFYKDYTRYRQKYPLELEHVYTPVAHAAVPPFTAQI